MKSPNMMVWKIYLLSNLAISGIFLLNFKEAGGVHLTSARRLKVTFSFSQCSIDSQNPMSNEKNPGWLGYIADYTTQVYRDYNRPL